jgi:hypothetical protein
LISYEEAACIVIKPKNSEGQNVANVFNFRRAGFQLSHNVQVGDEESQDPAGYTTNTLNLLIPPAFAVQC